MLFHIIISHILIDSQIFFIIMLKKKYNFTVILIYLSYFIISSQKLLSFNAQNMNTEIIITKMLIIKNNTFMYLLNPTLNYIIIKNSYVLYIVYQFIIFNALFLIIFSVYSLSLDSFKTIFSSFFRLYPSFLCISLPKKLICFFFINFFKAFLASFP